MTRQKITQALEKPMPLWNVVVLLVMITIAIIGAVWAHGTATYATKDAVEANQREIIVIREDIRGMRADNNRSQEKFREQQTADRAAFFKQISNLVLPEPPE